MDTVFLEIPDRLDTYEASLWIPASKILSFFIMGPFPDGRGYRVDVEAERIRNVRQYGVTPWLKSLEEAKAARSQLIQRLIAAPPRHVVRWRDSGFVWEPTH